jgi:hypothetical protein
VYTREKLAQVSKNMPGFMTGFGESRSWIFGLAATISELYDALRRVDTMVYTMVYTIMSMRLYQHSSKWVGIEGGLLPPFPLKKRDPPLPFNLRPYKVKKSPKCPKKGENCEKRQK